MSNTYFEIKKEVEYKAGAGFRGYTNNYRLSLTAFVGKEDKVQLTISTESTLPNQSGTGYITLSDKDIDLLIAGLMERKLGIISATGSEKSVFSAPEE